MADPSEKIRFSGRDQEAFLVDCRSLSGMSGSAVFVSTSQTYKGGDAVNVVAYHREALEKNLGITIDPAEVVREKVQSISGLAGPWLLGIDLGHIPMMKPIYEADGQTETGLRVDANTGIACVLPAWRILEVLAQDDLMKDRNRSERELAKELENEKKEPSAVQDVADYKIDNSDFTQSDFEADLRKVSRKIQPKKK